jgi:hypothetical protein
MVNQAHRDQPDHKDKEDQTVSQDNQESKDHKETRDQKAQTVNQVLAKTFIKKNLFIYEKQKFNLLIKRS